MSLKIFIGNKHFGHVGEYVGRPSSLGNPFPISENLNRDESIEKYKEWLHKKINSGDALVLKELARLYGLAKQPSGVTLTCWCHPKKCHAEVIKEVLEKVEPA